MDPSFEEKVRRIEQDGVSAADVHEDPNKNMAFTSFTGSDPGAKPGDEDYVKRKRDGETESPPKKRTKTATKANTAPAAPSTLASLPASLPATLPTGPAPTLTTPVASSGPTRVRLWQEDEVMFVLEKFAEWPEATSVDLMHLVNAHFPGRFPRSRQAVWQRFAGKGVCEALLSRLGEQENTAAASSNTAIAPQATLVDVNEDVEEENEDEDEHGQAE